MLSTLRTRCLLARGLSTVPLSALLLACGPRSQSTPGPTLAPSSVVPSAASSAAVALPAPAAAGSEPTFHLEGSAIDCVLRAEAGRVSATCAEGTLTCVEVARAELAASPGEEIVSRCDGPDATEHDAQALVVANGGALVWVLPLEGTAGDDAATCDLPPTVKVTVVDPVPDAPHELFIRQTGCEAPGLMTDADSLWKFVGSEVRLLAAAEVECQWVGDTADPDAPPPPPDEAWMCTGGYLAVEQAGAAWSVVRLTPEIEGPLGSDRDAQGRLRLGGRLQAETLRWDAASSRFVAQAPSTKTGP